MLGRVAALCAVALLNFAVVRSTVMQAVMAAPAAATCHEAMPGVAGMSHGAPEQPGKGKADRSCEFCDAAAHAPIQSAAIDLPTPSAVAWSPFRAWTSQGPRGPPSREPHARGPPSLLLI